MLGGSALRRGEAERAVEHLRAAVSTFASGGPGNRVWLALSLGLLGLAVAAQGDQKGAAAYLDQAWALRHQLGDIWPDAFALPRSGEPVQAAGQPVMPVREERNAIQSSDLPLTPREREVLRFLAEGRSNQEIANALSISPRTVATHIHNILGKLGVSSRAAAVAMALRQGMI